MTQVTKSLGGNIEVLSANGLSTFVDDVDGILKLKDARGVIQPISDYTGNGGGGGIITLSTGTCSTIRCGVGNVANGNYGSSLSGFYNVTCNDFTANTWGRNNVAQGCYSSSNGASNIVCARNSHILSGTNNTIACDAPIGIQNTSSTFSGNYLTTCAMPYNGGIACGVLGYLGDLTSVWPSGSTFSVTAPYKNGDTTTCSSNYSQIQMVNVPVICSTYSGGYTYLYFCYDPTSPSFVGTKRPNCSGSTFSAGYIQKTGTFSSYAVCCSNAHPNVIVGGAFNTINGYTSAATISGGYSNTISGGYGIIGAGSCNYLENGGAILSGFRNCATNGSVIAGGQYNRTCYGSFIGSGVRNCAVNNYSFIGSGFCNTSSANYSNVVGGRCNTVSGIYSAIVSGNCNTASGFYSVSVAGYNNQASGCYSFIGNGISNNASQCGSFVGGGAVNTASGPYSTIGGGSFNTSSSFYSFVGGGIYNTASNYNTIVGGGVQNSASGCYSAILGGRRNTSSGYLSLVGGGLCNNTSGDYSGILGGRNNVNTFCDSFVVGSNITANRNCTTFVNDLIVNSQSANAGCAVCFSTNGLLQPFSGSNVINRGLFSQTTSSTPVTNTIVATSIIASGVGSLSVPANGFSVGNSFVALLSGKMSSLNNAQIEFHFSSGGVVLADSSVLTLSATTNKNWQMVVYFTIRAIGGAGTASIVTSGNFTYNKDSANIPEALGFSNINSTTFNTTISNTISITAQWGSASASNTITTQIFTLNQVY